MENGDSSRDENACHRRKQTEYAMELKLATVRRVRAGESVMASFVSIAVQNEKGNAVGSVAVFPND